jgi:hypothetical protein
MSFLDGYLNYLKENSIEFSKNNVPVLSVPFPGFFGDAIEVFIEKNGSFVTVHDNGHTLESLLDIGGCFRVDCLFSGCAFDGKKIKIETDTVGVGEAIHALILSCFGAYIGGAKK